MLVALIIFPGVKNLTDIILIPNKQTLKKSKCALIF